jgi:exodeoxyribonuclease-5
MQNSWSPQQEELLLDIEKWWNNGAPEEQEYILFGYAGTGKTTLAKTFPDLFQLQMFDEVPDPDSKFGKQKPVELQDDKLGFILYCSFTGKAASVLRSKGLNAFTIHQSIYGAPIIDENKMTELVGKIEEYKKTGDPRLSQVKAELKRTLQPGFALKETNAKAAHCKLIVVDECSMIDEKLYLDLRQFGVPIVFMGDPAQLPPVGKSAGLIERRPNVMLTEIHRQALDNPILELATLLRESSFLPKIAVPELVVTNEQIDVNAMSEFDQVICGYHTTRRRTNNNFRQMYGFDEIPHSSKEKLINLKNDHGLKIMNGEMVSLCDKDDDDQTPSKDSHFFFGTLADYYSKKALGGVIATSQTIYNGYFKDTVRYEDDRISREWKKRKDAVELDWGYAITCHKSQGSEWDAIYIHDDGFGRSELDRRRWLYTALTRARSKAFISSRFAV